MSFANGGQLRAEVYIDAGDRAQNERAYARPIADRDSIEKEFGEPLRWEKLEGKRACRIACYTPGSIEDPAEAHEQHRRWAVDHLLKLKKVFGPRLPAAAAASEA